MIDLRFLNDNEPAPDPLPWWIEWIKGDFASRTVAASPSGLSRLRRLRGVASTIAGHVPCVSDFPTALSAGGNPGGCDVNRSAVRAPDLEKRAARPVESGGERGWRSAHQSPTRRPPSHFASALDDLRSLAIGMATAFFILFLMRGTI